MIVILYDKIYVRVCCVSGREKEEVCFCACIKKLKCFACHLAHFGLFEPSASDSLLNICPLWSRKEATTESYI